MSGSREDKYTKKVGQRLRTIRLSKKLTLNYIARQTGLTASFISQFERGLTTASIASMQKIAQVLGFPLASLFENGNIQDYKTNEVSIVRKKDRNHLFYPEPTLTKDYLLTKLDGKIQVIYSITKPGGESGEPYSHNSDEECIIIMSGKMELTVNNQTFTLFEGDTVNFSSRLHHSWKNTGNKILEVLWVITPPSF
ncbi:helix-turn-helix domain-containing protein [Virgibacillus sediminis]|uniref:Helix-turn-helix domain-containing protein n=1 Tax=Virgibacillus sediminis TaxID=202260 RepID=A0ABV7A5F1_9BACI